MDVEAEIRDLKRRILTKQVRAVHKGVLEFREDASRRFDHIEASLDMLPETIASAVGEALRRNHNA